MLEKKDHSSKLAIFNYLKMAGVFTCALQHCINKLHAEFLREPF